MGEFTRTFSCLNDFFHIPPLRNDRAPKFKLFFSQIKVKRQEYCEINLGGGGFYVHRGELNKVHHSSGTGSNQAKVNKRSGLE